MNLENVYANDSALLYLKESIKSQRISHAQLFIGKPGYGTLATALAYAKYVICEGKESCNQKVENLQHSDLHFSIPTFKIDKKEAVTKNYIQEFRELVLQNPYATLHDWYAMLDAGNKQGFLSKHEIVEVINTLSLKSYEGGYKILIIWNADKMKQDYANKFLKLLEEPPAKTLFLLIAENEENILETIRSRCLNILFKPLSTKQVQQYLVEKYQIEESQALQIAQQSEGNLNNASKLIKKGSDIKQYEKEFIDWTRNAFMAKSNPKYLQPIITQAEKLATWNKEEQKQYIEFCIETFRNALLLNYQNQTLVHQTIDEGFNFQKFSQHITGKNIENIVEELNQSHYYLERNANSKLTFVNLGIKLTRYIHRS